MEFRFGVSGLKLSALAIPNAFRIDGMEGCWNGRHEARNQTRQG